MDVGSADGHPRGDRERQCGRGGQVVELGGPSSDKFATTPTFHGGAICPSARESSGGGKHDDSVIGRSAQSQRQSVGTGAVDWERQATQDHRNHCCETRPFRPPWHSECGSQSRTVSDVQLCPALL